jgi:hypothetical protein
MGRDRRTAVALLALLAAACVGTVAVITIVTGNVCTFLKHLG